MPIDYAAIAAAGGISKGIPRKLAKGRRQRGEAKVKKSVRQQCVERDGYCLIASRVPFAVRVLLGPCDGPSEWAHVEEHRRCFTRGQAPEERHTTAGSGQMCHKHHADYDAHKFGLVLSAAGMNGEVNVARRAA